MKTQILIGLIILIVLLTFIIICLLAEIRAERNRSEELRQTLDYYNILLRLF